MFTRIGAPLAIAVLALLGSGKAFALGGVAKYGTCNSCGDSQTSFSDAANGSKPGYRLVYDTVQEKRFHVVHQTVNETVMKPVTNRAGVMSNAGLRA